MAAEVSREEMEHGAEAKGKETAASFQLGDNKEAEFSEVHNASSLAVVAGVLRAAVLCGRYNTITVFNSRGEFTLAVHKC